MADNPNRYKLKVPKNCKPGTVLQLTAHYGPGIQVTVPAGVQPGEKFVVKPEMVTFLDSFEKGGTWRHTKSEVPCFSPVYWNISCCAPCFIARLTAILRTGDANAKYDYLNIPCRNCCSNDETACSVCLYNGPMGICGPILWCNYPSAGINFSKFYKDLRDALEIEHEKSNCCYSMICENYGSYKDIGQLYLELRSRAKLTVDPAAKPDDNVVRIKNNSLVDRLYYQSEEYTKKNGSESMSANGAPGTQTMTRGGPYVVPSEEPQAQKQ